jgi:dethiobiotin synthetase
MPGVFVTGAGTNVGKTFVCAALIRALAARGRAVDALKPVVSGFDAGDWDASDPGRLLGALGRPADTEALDRLSPWRFAAPLSPDMAAAREGVRLDYAAVVDLCRARLAAAGEALLVIEGVGGVMSPISGDRTNLDLMAAIGAPVLLVCGAYLGTISHTLTAIAAVRSRGLNLRAVVVSEAEEGGPPLDETAASIARFAAQETVIIAEHDSNGWTADLLSRLD